MTNFTIAVTGHRPNKISRQLYSVDSPLSKKYIKILKDYILESVVSVDINNNIQCVSGMALGVDTLFALAVLELKSESHDHNFSLYCAIPCENHSSKWIASSIDMYNAIMAKADKIVYVSNQPYSHSCMQDRNKHMVDIANQLIAVWDGTAGGTGNCVKYAKQVGKWITYINPKQIF